MSEWANIDKLGSTGIEADRIQTATEPQSLSDAQNVRAIGPNLTNAGGFGFVSEWPGNLVSVVTLSQFVVEEVQSVPMSGVLVSQFLLGEVQESPSNGVLVSQYSLSEVLESNAYP